MATGLLAGISVLDLSGVGPGARCARLLADFGAIVTRIEPPARKGGHRLSAPYHAYGGGRGWRRLVLDMKNERGRDLFLQLAGKADVVVEGFRPGVAGRLGVGYDDVVQVNPNVVYCSISGYGQTGPAANWVGHDVDYGALAGLYACGEARADGAPALPGLTVADAAGGGMQAALSILAALLGRATTGKGRYLDVSMTEGVLYLLSMHIDEFLATGQEPGPGSSVVTGAFACYDFYRDADGRWIALGAIEAGFFANVCKGLDCGDWISHQFDPEQQDAIRTAFRAAFAKRPRREWLALFAQVDSCMAPVNSIAETTLDPHFLERGTFIDVEHPRHGRFRQVGPILAGMERPQGTVPLPSGEASKAPQVLAELGIGAEECARLVETGIVG